MSDYEVTLVNDNSKLAKGLISTDSTTSLTSTVYDASLALPFPPTVSVIILTAARQEFYVRFKGPDESLWIHMGRTMRKQLT